MSPEAKPSRFLHSFGYHLARQLVGNDPVDKCIRQANNDLRLRQQSSLQKQKCSPATPDEDNALFHGFRANWRSDIRFPWQLPVPDSVDRKKGEGYRKGDAHDKKTNILVQSLFVDITFDFLIFPAKFAGNNDIMHSCHVLEEKDCWKEADHSAKDESNSSPIAISVAIRIGALLALPKDRAAAATASIRNDGGNIKDRLSCEKSMNEDYYRYYYHRGNTALTMSDLNEHCRSIDIVLEDMNPLDVSRIFGEAFIDGCKSGDSWEIMSKKWNATGGDAGAKTVANYVHGKSTNSEEKSGMDSRHLENDLDQSRYYMKLHHGVLQADGDLPLSGSRSNGICENGPLEPIKRTILDMILLQSKCSGCNGICVAVPRTEVIALWREVDSRIVRELEARSVELRRQKLNNTRDITMEARGTTPIANDSDPGATAAPAGMIDANFFDETFKNNSSYDSGKSLLSRPPQPPNESALFARVKTTTQGGSRKKPKFRLGPA